MSAPMGAAVGRGMEKLGIGCAPPAENIGIGAGAAGGRMENIGIGAVAGRPVENIGNGAGVPRAMENIGIGAQPGGAASP